MRLIKITCRALSYDASINSYIEKEFSKYANVSNEDSVRNLAFNVYENGIERGAFSEDYVSRETLRNRPLEVGLFDGSKEHKVSPIEYKILSDGSIKFLDFYESLETDWSVGEVVRLARHKYISGNIRHLVFRLSDGLGSFAENVEIIAGIVGIIAFFLQYGPTAYKVISKKFKKTVSAWSERNVISLKEIRKFLSTKQIWKTDEIMTRLCVDEELAKAIMIKFGFTQKGNTWKFIENSKALRARSEWLKKEEEMNKAQEDFLHSKNNDDFDS